MSTRKNVGRFIGFSFAVAQHAVDSVWSWGFRKMARSSVREKTPAKPERKPRTRSGAVLDSAKAAGKEIVSFFGEVGESYYDEYGKLKIKEFKERKK